ncbi:MAG: DUF2813 domain-containing protein [Albidovulum sp.]|nr:DUF2813 domain-containing protein [Albidovulum sp.]
MGAFVRALELDDIARAEIEQALLELNSKVLAQHTAFDSVKDKIKKIADLLPLSDNNPVSIEAVPSKVFDILSRTQVNLASKTGAQIPIVRHGSGTQNLAVICLFEAFLESRLENGFGKYAEPFLTLEEPEAHLHPSAIKAVGKMLNKLSGQKLISTHSGELLAGVPLSKICRLRRRNGKIAAYRIGKGKLSSEELSKLDYHIRAKRGGLLFSRCWLLVEGETETLLLSECGHAMGRDLYADGISCIEYSQVGVEKFIKLADLLGIEWFVLADNDNAGKKYKKSAQDLLGEREGKDRIRLLDHGSMEEFLCEEGFGEIYKASISEQKKDNVTAKIGTDEYWKQVLSSQKKGAKTRNALVIAEEIVEQGKSAVPNLLKDVIERAQSLARSVS